LKVSALTREICNSVQMPTAFIYQTLFRISQASSIRQNHRKYLYNFNLPKE
jgi:hypothetical protein